jgi:4,5-dihydroxyphthalate decarboxylase
MALTLSIACDPFELVRALHEGAVETKDIELQFQPEMTNPQRHKAMVRDLAFDICELNISTYLIAREAGVPITALPVFLYRRFRHGSIFVNPEGRIKKPQDLAGAKIGCPNLQAAAVVWASGILQDTYGIDQRSPVWVTEREEDIAFSAPPDLKLERTISGESVTKLLFRGEVDAIMTPQLPQPFLDGHPKMTRLFPDYADRERDYFESSGIFPIMHVTAIKTSLVETHPWLPGRLVEAFELSKQEAFDRMRRDRTIPLAWFGARWEEERHILGNDPWVYGLGKENRKNLETAIRYTQGQGLIAAQPPVDTLFIS